jgi:hypothetical protein
MLWYAHIGARLLKKPNSKRQKDEMKQKVIDLLSQYPDKWFSPSRVSTATGIRVMDAVGVLEELVQDEVVSKTEMKYGLDRRLYRWLGE